MKEEIFYFYQTPENEKLIKFQICGTTFPNKNYNVTRNNSTWSCIEYVESGAGIIKINNKEYNVHEGDTFFLQQRDNHFYYADFDTPWKKYFVSMSGILIDKLTDEFHLKNIYVYKNLNIKKELKEIINLAKENTRDDTGKILGIITEIFIKMYNSIINISSFDTTARKIKEYIDMNIKSEFNLMDICDYVSLSKSHVIRVFKSEYAVTPYSYYLNKKIDLAEVMLMNTDLSIKEISYSLNFSDQYYFSNVFKKKNKISPREYRLEKIKKAQFN